MCPGHGMDNRARAKSGNGALRRVRGDLNCFQWICCSMPWCSGVLLGCFYAAVSLGLSVSFGLLDVPHVAHPAFLVMASYGVFFLNDQLRYRPAAGGAVDLAAALPVRSCRLPTVLRDIRKARQRCRRARDRVLLRHRVHHRGADHPAVRRRPALGHRVLYRQGLADRRDADSVPDARRLRGRRLR